MNSQEPDPSVEVVHLRRLLDIQPGCLMRVGADGTVLAANDGALMLLGGRTPAEALGRDFAVWVPPEQHDRWRAFTLAVVQGSPSSIECDIAPPSGDRYPTLFHAIPLTDHPDGVASMAVAARVISAQRQLEAAIGDLTEQLNERGAQLQARDEALAMAEGARRAAEANCARALADVRQLELALNDFASRQQQVGGAALQEAQQALASSERRGQEIGADRDALQRRLEEALVTSEQREQEVGRERDALQRRLEEALAAGQDREAALRQLQAAHADLLATHAAATVERDRLASALREHAVHLTALADGIPSVGGPVAADASVGLRVGLEERRP